MPEGWKKANITLVFKMGKKRDPGNHWTVSFTSVLSPQVMVWLILDTIIGHVKDRKVIRSTEHGFTKRK